MINVVEIGHSGILLDGEEVTHSVYPKVIARAHWRRKIMSFTEVDKHIKQSDT